MATKFHVVHGFADAADKVGDKASRFIAEVEAAGGTYLGSHSALGGSSSGVGRGEERTDDGGIYFALTIVYGEPSEEPTETVRSATIAKVAKSGRRS